MTEIKKTIYGVLKKKEGKEHIDVYKH